MIKKFTAKLTALMLAVTLALSGCAAPRAGREPAAEASATLGQLADYFIKAADDYKGNADRAAVLEGFSENDRATRLQMLVLAGRAFGKLPAPTGHAKDLTPPKADLTHAPDWAREQLQNLSHGGVLAPSDLEARAAEKTVTLRDAEILAARFFARYGSNLKDDFYTAVNKPALETLKVPAGSTMTGGSATVAANTDRQLHDLMKEIVNSEQPYAKGSPEQKIRDLYRNVMNIEARDSAGIAPLRKYLDAVDAAGDFTELYAVIAQAVNELGNAANGLFPMVAVTDTKDSTRRVMQLFTITPMMQQSDYDDPDNEMRMEYRETTINQLMAVGESRADAERHTDELLKIERALAGQAMSAEELGDPERSGARYTPRSLDELMPRAKPSQLFNAIGLPMDTPMQVFDKKQFAAYAGWFTEENLDIFKSTQKIALLVGYSPYLSVSLGQAYGYQSGTAEEQANEAVQSMLSDELGQVYVNRYFPGDSKAAVEKMVHQMIEAFKTRIGRIDWMQESTKKEAVKKLDSLTVLIGYPDTWDMNPAEIASAAEGGSYFANAAASEGEKWKKTVRSMNEPVDPRRFALAAFTVNAAASRNTNTLIFPAGILQAPFYDRNAPFEENLGAIGSTIAHEITHMFDDGGAKYDAAGNMRDWWGKEDYAHFQALCEKAQAFYEGREAAPGIPADGKETLSENISDIGGIACGLEVMSTMENPDYDAFFRSFARQWLRVSGYEEKKEQAEIDQHAPNNLRTNRVLANFQEFFDTYGIGPGDGMYVAPEDRMQIW